MFQNHDSLIISQSLTLTPSCSFHYCYNIMILLIKTIRSYLAPGTVVQTWAMHIHNCDWASDNGPSGHTNFDHIFHVCCIITNDLLKLLK